MSNASATLLLRIFRFVFLLVAIPLMLPINVPAATRGESRAVQSKILGRGVRYSVLLPPSYDEDKTRRYPVLYYLHGLGDNEQSLLNYGAWDLIGDLQEKGKIGEFIVVTPNGGHTFYVNSRDGRVRYEDFFIQEFIPTIDQRYRTMGVRAGRAISGTSMGGYGALRFAFKYPKLFVSVSAHMAALAEDLPDDVKDSFGQNLTAFGQPFDERFWEKNSPFTLARQAAGLNLLKIYFDCGQEDDYGFEAGAKELHELLKKLGVPHEFHLYPGAHNAEYVMKHIGESLRFHSHAFPPQK